ncbi:MAG TPA: hypothetical protein VHF00_04990 [Acidimicrobiales bacterium]|nr:hypothetical protein [Acidimicrobiales bacterium]
MLEGEAESPPRRYGLYVSAVLVALFFVRVLGEPWETRFPPMFPDALNPGRTDTYYAIAGLTPFRPSFYWAARPVLYPAFVWLLGRTSQLIVLGQMATYCAAFGVLCLTAHQFIRNRLIAIATVVVLVLIAIQGRFVLWNTQILSESLGVSLGIMVIAMWWRVAAAPTRRRVTWAWAWTILWMLVRDSFVIPVLLGVLPAAVYYALRSRGLAGDVRRRLVSGALIALLVSGYIYVAQDVSNRNRYPLYNNVGQRILPDPELRAWFERGGMPVDAALLGRQGKTAFDDDRFFVEDPSLARFREWADGPGERRMTLSVVLRARDWYDLLSRQWKHLLAYDFDAYDGYDVLQRLPTRMPFQLGGPGTPRALFLWLLAAAAVSWLAVGRAARPAPVKFAVVGVGLVLLELYTSFVADSLEVERHLVGPLSRLGPMLVVCIAIGLDTLWRERRAALVGDRDGNADGE